MENGKKALLVEGPIGKTLFKLTVPMVFGILSLVMFNLVDTFFVGQLGTAELAAMSFTFPVVLIISSVAMGLGIGTSAAVSRAIGEGDQYKVKRLATDSLSLSVLTVAIFAIIGLLTIDPTFRSLGASPEVLPLIRQYMTIWYPGVIFIVVPMVGNNSIRATGDSKTPSAIMLVAMLTNIVLDPLFIFGIGPFPRLELVGAAIATNIARAITLIVSISILYYREKMITFALPKFSEVLSSWKPILYVGLPAAATNIVVPLATGVITRLVSVYGPEAVGAFGVVSRIDMFALTVVMALSSVLSPFVGQNLGGGRRDRVSLGVKGSQAFALVWGGVMFILILLAARPIASIFSDNPDVISNIVLYLWIVPISYGLRGVLLLSSSALNVLKKPIHASALAITQMFVLAIPLAYAGSSLVGLRGVFAATAIANIIAGIAAYLTLRKILTADESAAISAGSVVPRGVK